MKIKLVCLVVMIAFLVLPSIRGRAQIQSLGNTTCPVMPGERVKQKFYVDYQSKRIYLCCRNCVIKFKRNPEKYIKNLKDQ